MTKYQSFFLLQNILYVMFGFVCLNSRIRKNRGIYSPFLKKSSGDRAVVHVNQHAPSMKFKIIVTYI